MSLLLNRLLPAPEVFDPAIKDWQHRLSDAPDDLARVQLTEQLLLKRLSGQKSRLEPVQAALMAMRRMEEIRVEVLCHQVGWNYKRLERAFLKEVGYTPKTYAKLVRFNKAIRRMKTDPSLTSVGHACGYYDQAHFIKDFSRFAGTTPRQFRSEENPVAELLIRHQPV
jgi:transcriptional regulator GlxA family with amidase domain